MALDGYQDKPRKCRTSQPFGFMSDFLVFNCFFVLFFELLGKFMPFDFWCGARQTGGDSQKVVRNGIKIGFILLMPFDGWWSGAYKIYRNDVCYMFYLIIVFLIVSLICGLCGFIV
jgi:hypothetical protein